MAFVVVRCHDITKLKRFLEAISFSAASTSLLPQLPFQHVLLSINESSYLLVPDSLSSDLLRLLPAAQNQIIMKVKGLDASMMSVSMQNGKIEDNYSTEYGRLCLAKYAEEKLQIFMIEVNENHGKDAASSGNSTVEKNYVVMIFAEWAIREASLSSSYPSGSEMNSANGGRKESNVFSNGSVLSTVDSASHRQDARAAIYRALSSDSSNSSPMCWSARRSKAARSNEALIRKIMLNSNSKLNISTTSSIPSAKEFGVLSPSKSVNNGAFAEVESNSTTPKTAMKKSDTEERKNGVKNNSEVSFEDDSQREKEKEKEIPWNPDNEGVNIPSLELTLLSNGVYRTMTANSPKPIPFENDIFVGHLLLLVNTKPICNQYLKRFEGHQYTFDMQVQGKFKSVPKGSMFMGAEITKKMELGLFTKGICSSILQVVRAVNPYLHHAFGDKKDYELPHIVGPMWSLFDRLEITPPGGQIPDLGGLMNEEAGHRTKRRKTPNFFVDANTSDTYSMSFKTSSLELVDWTIVKVPVMGEMDLHTFWGDADLRLVAYMVPDSVAGSDLGSNGLPKTHPQESNNYLFSIDVRHESNHPEMTANRNSDSRAAHHTPAVIDLSITKPKSLNKKKIKGEASPNMRGIAPTRQFHSVYQDKEGSHGEKRDSTDREGERKGSEDDDDEEQSHASFDSTDDEENEDDDEDDDEKYFSAEEGDFEGEGFESYLANRRGNRSRSGSGIARDGDRDSSSDSEGRRSESKVAKMGKSRLRSEMSNKISPFLRGFGQRPQSRNPSPKSKKMSISTALDPMTTSNLVLAAVEVDERRIGRPKGRRFLYAFLQSPSEGGDGSPATNSSPGSTIQGTMGGSSSSSALLLNADSPMNSNVRMCTLRSYKEWTAEMPKFDQIEKPCNYKRMSEIGRRRYMLNQSYNYANNLGIHDPSMKYEVQKFLLVTKDVHDIHEIFLTKCPSGILNGLQAKRLRTGLPPFLMDSLVCVQLGNYHWSEECLGLTVGDLIFIKHSNRLRGAIRLCLPLNTILTVRSCSLSEVSLAIPDCYPMTVSTFSREYTILLRGEDNRNKWVEAISAANPCINDNRLILDTLSFSEESCEDGVSPITQTARSTVLQREHPYGESSDEEIAYSERAVQTRQNRRHSEPHAATQASLDRVGAALKKGDVHPNQEDVIPLPDLEHVQCSKALTLVGIETSHSEDAAGPPSPTAPQGGSTVTVVQMPSSHLNWNIVNSYNSPADQIKGTGAFSRARFHSKSIDVDSRHDDKDDDIMIKRTPSFLQILAGKGKTPPKSAEKDKEKEKEKEKEKKGFLSMGIFKRKKSVGIADPTRTQKSLSASCISHTPEKDSAKIDERSQRDYCSSSDCPSRDDEKDVIDLPTRIVRALSIGGSRPETDASSSDPVGAGFLRGRAGSLNRPEGLKSINTSYLPLSTERAKGGSADMDSALKNGIPSPMSYSQAQTQHPHAAPSSSSSTYHPRHLDLLVKPKGWKLGDKLILNARAFTLGAAHYTNYKDRDRDRDGGRDKERDRVFVRDRDRGERSLAKLLDRPHLLVAALLQLAFNLSATVNEEPPPRGAGASRSGLRSARSHSPTGGNEKGPFLGTDDPLPSSFRGLGDSAMVRSPKTVVDDFIFGVANGGKHKGGEKSAVMGSGAEKNDSTDRERDVDERDRGHDCDSKEKDKEKEKDLKLVRKEARSNSVVDSFKFVPDEKNGKEHQAAVVDNYSARSCLTSCDSVTTDSVNSNYISNSNSGHHANVATPTACLINTNSSNSKSNSNSNNATSSSKDLYSNSTPGHNALIASSPLVPSPVTEELPNDFMSEEVQALWIEFMDGVALLQAADASSIRPDSDEALCVFLNLYHLMVIHSSLVMGPPCSAYKWVGFFGCVSYEVFGDFISIAELEHCILRNDMSRPKIGLIAKHVIPQTRFAFTLHRKDFRLLWAINCGSYSLLPLVPIYEPSMLDSQLDAVMRLSMPMQIVVGDNGAVTLPTMCQWYSKDIEEAAAAASANNSAPLTVLGSPSPSLSPSVAAAGRNPLNILSKYCKGSQLQAVNRLLSKKTPVSIKYSSFDYRCRFFQQLTEADVICSNNIVS